MSTELQLPLTVSRELLEVVATVGGDGEQEPDQFQKGHRHHERPGSWLDIRTVLKELGIDFREKTSTYGRVLQLDRYLTSEAHADGTCVIEFPSGALAYRCLHDTCAGKSWADARVALGLGRSRRDTTENANGAKDPTVFQVLWDDEIEDLAPPAWLVNGYLVEHHLGSLRFPRDR